MTEFPNRPSLVLAATVGLWLVSVPARAQLRQVVDLGSLGGPVSSARGINKTGRVAGVSSNAWGDLRAFRTGNYLSINPATDDMGDLGGGETVGFAINDTGFVAGASRDTTGLWTAFLRNATTLVSIGTLGGAESTGTGINTGGKVVGWSENSDGDRRAFLFSNGVLSNLGTLGGNHSEAAGISSTGIVVGFSTNASGDRRAFKTAPNVAMVPGNDLGTLAGAESVATAINSAGAVVGSAQTAPGDWHAFRHTGTTMTDLGTLGGLDSTALAINTAGRIVGTSDTVGGEKHAFEWFGGTMTDLNDLIGDTGWVLQAATGINDSGIVVGEGTLWGDRRAFLLRPISLLSLKMTPTSVVGGNAGSGTVTLSAPAPADATVSLTDNLASIQTPTSVIVPQGASTVTFSVPTSAVSANASGSVTATYGGVSKSAPLGLTPVSVASVVFTPVLFIGSATVTGTVTLEAPAGPGNLTVALSSTHPSILRPEATVVIPAGSTGQTFTMESGAVSAVTKPTVTAALNGRSKTAIVTVNPIPPKSVSVSPSSVKGGTSTTATVQLEFPAGPGPITVSLSSSKPSAASVPATVTIPAGQSSATVTVTTFPVAANTLVTLKATANAVFKTATLTVTK